MQKFQNAFLSKALIFVSGFVILALEIIGIRVLAPHIGTTAPVWAGLIGATLAGSAVGYYLGGFLADKEHGTTVLLWLSTGAGLTLAIIPFTKTLLETLPQSFQYGTTSLIGSMLLFFLPVMLLSAITTYTIRIFVKNTETIAQVHGDLYAIATVGSIVGIFGTSYALIPLFTTPDILYGLAVIVIALGLLVSNIFETKTPQ